MSNFIKSILQNPVALSLALSVISYLVTLLTPYASSSAYAAVAVFLLTQLHYQLSPSPAPTPEEQPTQPAAPAKAPYVATAPTSASVTTTSYAFNQSVYNDLVAGDYDIYANSGYVNGMVYGVASPTGYVYYDTLGNVILSLAEGVSGGVAGSTKIYPTTI